MCGIAGIVKFNNSKIEYKTIKRFTDSMVHRGPDGGDYMLLNDSYVAFGHRRLSILDLTEAGTQPMTWIGRYTITYNGEVYNFIELKNELQKDGFKFKTETDTEIILAAFEKWGIDSFNKFNGMWAIAIYDAHNNKLFLSRDRFGVKPLYYTLKKNEYFAFASETIAFKHLDDFKREFDETVLLHSIVNPNAVEPTGYSLYKDIYQLSAGCYIEIDSKNNIKETRWWDTFKHVKKNTSSFSEQVEQFRELFLDACKIRLRSDVPLASALSGGVDSSSVYCMIHHLMNLNLNTSRTAKSWQKAFVATFPNTSQDERKFAEQVISYTKGEVSYIEPNYSNLVDDIVSSTVKFDGITGTPIAVVANVYRAMRQNGIIVSMDGHGADELMYGYRSSVAESFYDVFQNQNQNPIQQDYMKIYLDMYPEHEQENAKIKLLNSAKQIERFENRQKKFMSVIKNKLKGTKQNLALKDIVLADWYNHKKLNALPIISTNYYRFPKLTKGELKLANDFHVTDIPYNLKDFDRASMQHGIEIRMPFMDYRVVTFLFSLPQNAKMGNGFTKLILRESMKDLMPEAIRTRKLKIGLSAPITNWFNGALSQYLIDTVNSNNFLNSPYWNGKLLKNFVTNKTNSKTWADGESEQFWNILNAHILLTNAN